MGTLSYEELLSELQGLIGAQVVVEVHGWNAARDERRRMANLGGRLAAGYAADFSAVTDQLPHGESVLFAVEPDGTEETPATYFVVSRADFQGAARGEPGNGVGFLAGDVFFVVKAAT